MLSFNIDLTSFKYFKYQNSDLIKNKMVNNRTDYKYIKIVLKDFFKHQFSLNFKILYQFNTTNTKIYINIHFYLKFWLFHSNIHIIYLK